MWASVNGVHQWKFNFSIWRGIEKQMLDNENMNPNLQQLLNELFMGHNFISI